ncbi:OsmC family protein [Solitalea lacus]|uniref:OsmC family protein n=1 Tax=Solitalea lacus TaxID=2911172 RepID=UPI001EDBE417|nr:OsmC family protein [Solitalea lacus]UKJ06604.1 OsmC family protein [Solitalea lacus]
MEKNIAKALKTVTAIIGNDNYKTMLQINNHLLVADEPEQVGGKDQGPAPAEFLMSSLATCTAITLRMYVQHKSWDVGEINVQVCLEHNNDHGNLTTNIVRFVSVSKQVDYDKLQHLIAIANSCPIHNLLTHPININTSIKY